MKKQPSRYHVEIMSAFEIFHSEVTFRSSHPELFYEKDIYFYEKSQEINCAGVFLK